jgi:hypothetical protein|tara:strand:- start:130 stop:384 length:255 start_codon:yes stop_codon:yes gene_type:complete
MTIEIHKNIPTPGRGLSAYPLMDLEVGDCFFVGAQVGTDDGVTSGNSLRSFVSRQHRRLRESGDTRRFRVARYDENTLGVWRVK